MAPGIKFDAEIRNVLKDHLRLRRKGNAVQLVWEVKSEITPGKIWTTLMSEVSVTDIPNQKRGNLHNAKK